ncbi:LytTR family transcriptional regulator DNA-binding domain-containing protein [Kordia sp.]|uniref:LytTR family transcriptional regulator DNA-binding domain-containing protein n=1 Tax=Kordia sp. TaxID=1965332 RepID=UPI003D28E9A5
MSHYQYLILLFFTLNICHAQEHVYKHFGVDEGLPSSEVYDVYQDKQGYIWCATDKGLARYNGYEFENFTTQDGLPDNVVLDFFPQKNGQIWCYGYQNQEIFYFDEDFKRFHKFKYNNLFKKYIRSNTVVKSIVVDKNESIHIGGYNIYGKIEITKDGKDINRYEKNTNTTKDPGESKIKFAINTKNNLLFSIYDDYEFPENILTSHETNMVNSRLKFDRLNKNQYAVINNGLWILSKNGSYTAVKTSHAPIGVKQINDSLFFVGYYNNGAEIRNVSGAVIKTFLPEKSVTNFLIDTEGGYWFSTLNHGVFYVKNPKINVFRRVHVSSLTKNNENVLFAGFNNGNIVNITKGKINVIYKALNINKAIVEYDKIQNHFYGYSDKGFINYTLHIKDHPNYVRKIPENVGNPLLYSGTSSYTVIKNDTFVTHKLNHKTQDVCMLNGEVLIATTNGLFVHRDSVVKKNPSLDFLNLRIDDIDINKKATTVYMATHDAGVVVYGNRIYNIMEEDGLTNNIVSEVHIENDSIVWACTNSGLNKISFLPNDTFKITTITKEDGLLSNDINDVEIVNDTVWVATKEGLCFFKKDMIATDTSSKMISLHIKEVKVNTKSIDDAAVKLPHYQNNIDFSLLAISHKNSNNFNYLYRIKEIDTNWIATKNRNIRFPLLSPGNYTFQAKACVLNTNCDNVVSYTFKIMPPFWKTWWFYSMCVFLLSGIVYLFFKIRVFTYNKDIIRELIRLAIKRLKREEKFINFRSNGEDFKVPTYEILYVKSQGNYLDIITEKKTYTIRCKIGDFIATTPDALEYLRIHRSHIIRIDKVSSKGKNWVVIKEQKIPVGETYLYQLEKIQF